MRCHNPRVTRRTMFKIALVGTLALATPLPLVAAVEAQMTLPSATFIVTPPLAPTIRIVSPIAAQMYSGRVEIVAAAANVTSVEYRIDGSPALALGYDAASARWRTTLDTSTLSSAAHRLAVIAHGRDGSVIEVPVDPLLVRDDSPTSAPITYSLGLRQQGPGTVVATPAQQRYTDGDVVAITPQPIGPSTLTGWLVDGASRGWAIPLQSTMDHDHTITGIFADRPTYRDVGETTPYAEAIAQLAARGIVRGYADGTFGPRDTLVRCQLAALLVRAMGWSDETASTPFTDRAGVDDELWRAVGILAGHDVARGYGDGTYGTVGAVLEVQVVAFVARAMVARGYWTWQLDTPARYPDIPQSSGHRRDLATYVRFAGAVTGAAEPSGHFAGWAQPASRGWFASILWQALDSYFGVGSS